MEFSGSNEEGRGVASYIRGITPVARGGGDRPPAAPVGWAQWSPGGAAGPPVARWGGDMPSFYFRDLVANLKKKITLRTCRPMGGRPGDIFKIF